jgi:hypothetical protein
VTSYVCCHCCETCGLAGAAAGLCNLITQPFSVVVNSAVVGVGDYLRGSVVLDLDSHLALSSLCVRLSGKSKAFFAIPQREQVAVYDQNGRASYTTTTRECFYLRIWRHTHTEPLPNSKLWPVPTDSPSR